MGGNCAPWRRGTVASRPMRNLCTRRRSHDIGLTLLLLRPSTMIRSKRYFGQSAMAAIIAVFTAFSGAETASAVEPCSLVGNVSASPRHPGKMDAVSFNVSIPWFLVPPETANQIVARATIDPAGGIDVDALLTPRPGDFPDWRLVSVAYRVDSVFATVGPLVVGEHAIRSNVLLHDAHTGVIQSVCPDALPRTTLLTVGETAALTQQLPVLEYYNATLDHYFITQNTGEIADLDSGVHPGWTRTGESFNLYVANASDGRGHGACRWYGLPAFGLDTHFFSASLTECNQVALSPLTEGRWENETANAFEATLPDTITGVCPNGTVPVYRLWNNRVDSNHRYTTRTSIRQSMIAEGYIPEGFGPDAVAMCALGQ